MAFKNDILQKISREFTEKEKYNILMEDYFNMIRKVSHIQELQDKYNAIKEQHKNLQSKYTKLKNKYGTTKTNRSRMVSRRT